MLDRPDAELFRPVAASEVRVTGAVRFADRAKVRYHQDNTGITLRLPERPETPDCIIELTAAR